MFILIWRDSRESNKNMILFIYTEELIAILKIGILFFYTPSLFKNYFYSKLLVW